MQQKRGFGYLFGKTIEDFRNNFKSISLLFLILSALPTLILVYLVLPVNLQTMNFFSYVASIRGILYIIFLIASLFLSALMYLSIIYIGFNSDKKLKFDESIKQSKKYFWRYLSLVIVLSIFLLGLFLLLIIPGVIFFIYWILAYVVLIGEDKGIMSSLGRSRELIRGNWWRTLGYFILIFLIFLGISFLIGSVSVLAAVPLSGTPGIFVKAIFSLIANWITIPLGLLFMKNYYLARVNEKEVKIVKKDKNQNNKAK